MTPAGDPVERARVAALEAERRRVFEDAQREADTMFAQYQLSQLLAAGDTLEDLAPAILAEIAAASGAAAAALWLAEPNEASLALVAAIGTPGAGRAVADPPPCFADSFEAAAWAGGHGWSGATLEERRDLGDRGLARAATGFVAVRPAAGAVLEPGHARYLALVRRELAITFRAAQLRSSLARERATLAAILEGASDAIVAVDADRRVVRLNGAAARLLDRAPSEVIGTTCRASFGCGDGPAADGGAGGVGDSGGPTGTAPDDGEGALCGPRCPFELVLEEGRPIVAGEQRIRTRGGAEVPVAGSFAPMPDRAAGAVAVLRDLRPSLALDELKSSFVAAVSHELRTPLALISGYAQSLLRLDLDADTTRGYLERMETAVERLTELVDEVIDISRVESDQLSLHRGPVAVDELMGSFVAEHADLPGVRPIELEIQPGLPLVDVDASRIHQVLANLAANSAKYAGPGTSVSIRVARGDHRTVVITFSDDGAGIDDQEKDHIFERFYRGRDVRESRIPGSGLGLYLSRRLVEAHGGWIRLDPTARGTSISLGIPAATAEPRDPALDPPTAPGA